MNRSARSHIHEIQRTHAAVSLILHCFCVQIAVRLFIARKRVILTTLPVCFVVSYYKGIDPEHVIERFSLVSRLL